MGTSRNSSCATHQSVYGQSRHGQPNSDLPGTRPMTFEEYLEALKNQSKPDLMLDFGRSEESVKLDPDEVVEVGEWEADV